MPPARRAQQNAAPSNGASIDPAIISSQIARTEPAEPQKSEKPENPEEKTEKAAPAKETKPVRQTGKTGTTATENVESEVLDSFRQFANIEKMKVQDHKRSRTAADKAVKLNDLMRFSKNFKLLTPVPKDLIPILAKDESKQREIVQKAQRIAESSKAVKAGSASDSKSQKISKMALWEGDTASPTIDPNNRARNRPDAAQLAKDRHSQARDVNTSNRPIQNGLSARLTDSHRLHKQNVPATVPNPLPIQPTSRQGSGFSKSVHSPQKAASLRGPPSATSAKFNVQAMEFKPNPTANAFKPSSTIATASPSPRSTPATRTISPAINPPPKFFTDKDKKVFANPEERPTPLSITKPTQPSTQEKEASTNGGPKQGLPAANGFFQWPYRTHPTWTIPDSNEPELKYYEPFGPRNLRHTTPPHHASPINLAAHQHQLPLHLQNGAHAGPVPQVQTPQQLPHQLHPQPHHYPHTPHYDDHHMRPSASTSSVYPAPSPRMQNSNMAYQSPMPRHAQLAYGQPNVQYVMQPHPQMNGRQFSNGPPMMQPQHLAPMMVQQPSASGYMAQPMQAVPYNGQLPMYPGPSPSMYGSPSQPPSGYPSPAPAAPMMMHQGSHQGQHQPMMFPAGQFAQPVYAQQPPAHSKSHVCQSLQNSNSNSIVAQIRGGGYGSPQPHLAQNSYPQPQQPHFQNQPHRTPSTGYVQPHQAHHQHMNSQPPPQPAGPPELGEEAK